MVSDLPGVDLWGDHLLVSYVPACIRSWEIGEGLFGTAYV